MKREIFFVDFENIQNLQFKKRDDIESEIILFAGSKQSSLQIETLINLMSASLFKIVKVDATTKNALDFTLSIEVGSHHETEDIDTKFIIVSQDKGFEAVRLYIQNSGREIELRSNFHKENPKPKVGKTSNQYHQRVITLGQEVIKRYSQPNFSRAGKVETFKNQISSLFRKEALKKEEIEDILHYLQDSRFIRIEKSSVIYL